MGINMKKNLGILDRGTRTIIALILGTLIATGSVTGTTAILLGVVAFLLLSTSMIGFCPLYFLAKISTKRSVE
jgi:hypothetical protein